MKTIIASLTASLTLLTISLSYAKEPDDLAAILKETQVTEKILEGALREELRRDTRVTSVAAEFIAPQGVVVAISLNTPWLRYDERGEPSFEFHGNITLPEIPAMVTNILQDLQLNAAPYEPEALEDLRELREEQRDLRTEQREFRSELRAKRRALVRERDDSDKRQLEEEISRVERELALIDQQYDALSAEIEGQYAALRAQPPAPKPAPEPTRPSKEPEDVNIILAQAVCDYGPTLKSLDSDQYLTLAVRQGRDSRYYSFEMDDVRSCSRNNMSVERLLENAYQYEG